MAPGINLPALDLWISSVRVLHGFCTMFFFLLVTAIHQSHQKEACHYSCYSDTVDCNSMNISNISLIYARSNYTENSLESKMLKNSINPVDQVTVKDCRLRVLNLQLNYLFSLENAEWNQMKNLEYLDLSRNKIVELPSGVFNLPSLISLNISFNLIGTINNGSFRNLPSLRSLDLSGNPVGSLSLAWFDPITDLHYLYLSKCDILIIPDGFGAVFLNLKVLDLSGNQIQLVTGAQIQQLENISVIINKNPFHCDCRLIDFQTWVSNQSYDKELVCATPKIMNGQILQDIPNLCNSSHFDPSNVHPVLPAYPTRNTQLPYDPMMGIGTAVVLSGMLVLFLLCVLLDKLKRKLKHWWRKRSDKESQYSYSAGRLDSISKLHTFPEDSLQRTGSQYKGSQCNCDSERRSISIQSSFDAYQKGLCVPRTSLDGKTLQYHSENIIDPCCTETHL